MNRKPLEGIESLLFVLGVGTGYLLSMQEFSWWIVILAAVALGLAIGKLVDFLRSMNSKVE